MIKLIKSAFYNEKATKKRLCDFILKTSQLSTGKQCADFEKAFSAWQGRKYSVMFNSGSSANLALMQALMNMKRLTTKDLVGFSAVTWATNVMPIISMGMKPIPLDIELDTLNVSSSKVIDAYKKYHFKCLFLTNLLGFSDDIGEIRKFCNKNKIILIEDNCESLGSEHKGEKLGNFGLASTFSFFVGHHMSTIEGGMVCTDDKELDTMLRIVRSHGWDRHLDVVDQKKLRNKHGIDEFYGKYTFYDIGYNLRPTEIQGFLGLDQLKFIESIISQREKNYRELESIFSNGDFIKLDVSNLNRVSNFAFPLICRTKAIRDKYIALAEKAEIEIRPIVGGNIGNQVFFKKYIKDKFELTNSEIIHHNAFYFGNNPEMTKSEIVLLIKIFSNKSAPIRKEATE